MSIQIGLSAFMCFSFAFNSIVYPMGVSKKSDLCQCQCQSNNDKNSKISRDNLFTAIKKKMKVLKKIKKRMGLGRSKILKTDLNV